MDESRLVPWTSTELRHSLDLFTKSVQARVLEMFEEENKRIKLIGVEWLGQQLTTLKPGKEIGRFEEAMSEKLYATFKQRVVCLQTSELEELFFRFDPDMVPFAWLYSLFTPFTFYCGCCFCLMLMVVVVVLLLFAWC